MNIVLLILFNSEYASYVTFHVRNMFFIFVQCSYKSISNQHTLVHDLFSEKLSLSVVAIGDFLSEKKLQL